jgi:hypothetical protein
VERRSRSWVVAEALKAYVTGPRRAASRSDGPGRRASDLIASKRTGRLQDAADIEVLEEIRRLRGA